MSQINCTFFGVTPDTLVRDSNTYGASFQIEKLYAGQNVISSFYVFQSRRITNKSLIANPGI